MATFDFFAAAHRLEREGKPFATATVVRIERPTSGKPGDRAIVTPEGELHGWIGGSCARPTVIREALAALSDGESRLIRLSSEPEERGPRDGITDLSMTCFSGGTMEIFIDPKLPRPRLLIVGDQALARALAALGRALGYEIYGVSAPALEPVDGRLEGSEAIPRHAHPMTAVIVATHGDHDEIALEHALESRATYVGLVASRKRTASIRKYLGVRGIDEARLAALHAPAGLDIGAREPEEIALSILAELVQLRRGAAGFEWAAEGDGAATDGVDAQASEPSPAESETVETAIDPVCGMTVAVAACPNVHEHDGTRYYFCCGGCLTRFAEEPQNFVTAIL